MTILGVDTSLLAGIFGGVQGHLFAYLKNSQNNKLKYKLAKLRTQSKDVALARNNTNKHIAFTRRIVTLIGISYLFFGPWIASFIGIPILIEYTHINGIFLWFLHGSSSIEWIPVRGFVITPQQAYLITAMSFYYYGMSGSRPNE